MDEEFPSPTPIDLKVTGNVVECDESKNLVVKAYHLLAQDYELPRVHAHLVKRIPMQAGLGGGSADAAYMIRLLDERFRLNMGNAEMERYAAKLGADCAFFIRSEIAFARGIGDILEPVDNEVNGLEGYYKKYSILSEVKEKLYNNGAVYAQMSGSGSTIFGIFGQKPKNIKELFPNMFTYCVRL